ncbi:hypothetical protein BC567DRAFT_209069 [Phyllosticta citribraziliensis]
MRAASLLPWPGCYAVLWPGPALDLVPHPLAMVPAAAMLPARPLAKFWLHTPAMHMRVIWLHDPHGTDVAELGRRLVEREVHLPIIVGHVEGRGQRADQRAGAAIGQKSRSLQGVQSLQAVAGMGGAGDW